MALKFTKRVKFAYDYDWQEGLVYLNNQLSTLKEQAQVLQKVKPLVWDVLVNQYGTEPFEVPFVQIPISSDMFKWLPWYEQTLWKNVPPLCDGALNDAQFSIKWMRTEDMEAAVPEYTEVKCNKFEFLKVTEFYIMQIYIRRVVSADNSVDFLTSCRVLLYTSNF